MAIAGLHHGFGDPDVRDDGDDLMWPTSPVSPDVSGVEDELIELLAHAYADALEEILSNEE